MSRQVEVTSSWDSRRFHRVVSFLSAATRSETRRGKESNNPDHEAEITGFRSLIPGKEIIKSQYVDMRGVRAKRSVTPPSSCGELLSSGMLARPAYCASWRSARENVAL
ncbi:hypothetical protein EYF80_060874 [Liparis tanakae]|uniref:Uncharacterized protein n=1 Tax=Liparis tanakae TaxID=230148 RepID=A0A4Z2EJN0_9TELE|nr:hypothetical protein EYF80_060874 [Liparis tanakae]